MKKYELDARGLDCPKPLLRTKQALEEQDFRELTVLVSHEAARENVLRFLNQSGFESASWEASGNGEFAISAVKAEGAESGESSAAPKEEGKTENPQAADPSEAVVLIASDRIGMGKKELGRLLLKGYLYTLGQLDSPPSCLIFMNTGIRLVLNDSDSLEDLKGLKEKGVEILVCGTCLDYLDARDRMEIGRISNMYEISQKLHGPGKVVSFT